MSQDFFLSSILVVCRCSNSVRKFSTSWFQALGSSLDSRSAKSSRQLPSLDRFQRVILAWLEVVGNPR